MKPLLCACLLITSMTSFAASGSQFEVPFLSTQLLLNAGSPENTALKNLLTIPPVNPKLLSGKRIAVLTTDGVEEIELNGTLKYFRDRGAKADLVAPRLPIPEPKFGVAYPPIRATHILTAAFLKIRTWNKIDYFIDQVRPQTYDAIIIPGGAWNPDSLRILPEALALIREFFAAGKITAAICHGPAVFINAGILKGRQATATWNIQIDLQNAGALVKDIPVVVDGNLVTSRHPLDMPQFVGTIQRLLLQK